MPAPLQKWKLTGFYKVRIPVKFFLLCFNQFLPSRGGWTTSAWTLWQHRNGKNCLTSFTSAQIRSLQQCLNMNPTCLSDELNRPVRSTSRRKQRKSKCVRRTNAAFSTVALVRNVLNESWHSVNVKKCPFQCESMMQQFSLLNECIAIGSRPADHECFPALLVVSLLKALFQARG